MDRLQEIRARLNGLSWVGDEFIAHAPADIAWLLELVEELCGDMAGGAHAEDCMGRFDGFPCECERPAMAEKAAAILAVMRSRP